MCQWFKTKKEIVPSSVGRTYDGTPFCILERYFVELLVTFNLLRISRNHVGRDTFELFEGKRLAPLYADIVSSPAGFIQPQRAVPTFSSFAFF